jgi:hypothetical protein
MTPFWRTESCCYISRSRATQNFVVYCVNGTARKDFTLQEEGLAFLTIRRGESKVPAIGRTQQHIAVSSAHQTGNNEEFCYGYG